MAETNMIVKKGQDLFVKYVAVLKNLINKHFTSWWSIVLPSLILLQYFGISILLFLLRFKNNNSLTECGYPLTLMACYLLAKFQVTSLTRWLLACYRRQKRVVVSSENIIHSVAAPGVAHGLELGLSYLTSQLLPISLYMMTESVAIIWVLYFAISFQLEKMSWSLKGIALLISLGLAMVRYDEPVDLNLLGMLSGTLVSCFYGFHWTMIQNAMQKPILGLNEPIDMMYHIQPWTLLTIIPIAMWCEGTKVYNNILIVDWNNIQAISMIIMTIYLDGLNTFCLDFSQYTIVSRMSSLTLCVAEIFRTGALFLVFDSKIYVISDFNFIGILTCFSGIVLYVIFKVWTTENEANENLEENTELNIEKDSMILENNKITTIGDIFDKEKNFE